MAPRTLYDKLWDDHVVNANEDGSALIYIDRHLLHEVTTPQAFEGLKLAGRLPWRIGANLAVSDHNVPTTERSGPIEDPISRLQVDTLDQNCDEHGIEQFKMNDPRQGIVHIIGPEQGATLPGMTVVCGDSHTSTHGALACLATGIGTSEVEQVLASQCLVQMKMKNMRVLFKGLPGPGVTAKDMALAMIGEFGTIGGTGYAIEYQGEAVQNLSIEGRMTLCNMTIEFGARNGMVAVDEATIEYVKGRPFAPKGEIWEQAVTAWRDLVSDPDAVFDKELVIDAAAISPQVTWGTSPELVAPVTGVVPDPADEPDETRRQWLNRSLEYMGLKSGDVISEISIDKVFIGSCTNGRIEDMREAAEMVRGKQRAENVTLAMVVPGSGLVKQQAEEEGLDKVFLDAGFEWREPGCSMCLAMNADRLNPQERCAATSNRNFEGRQGQGGRTHLVSPAMAAAAGIAGHFVDIRDWS